MGFGAWEDKNSTLNAAATQAPTDGFVIVHFRPTSNANNRVCGYTDTNTTPTTERVCEFSNAGGNDRSFMMPVRKNEYWKVTREGDVSVKISWVGIGK